MLHKLTYVSHSHWQVAATEVQTGMSFIQCTQLFNEVTMTHWVKKQQAWPLQNTEPSHLLFLTHTHRKTHTCKPARWNSLIPQQMCAEQETSPPTLTCLTARYIQMRTFQILNFCTGCTSEPFSHWCKFLDNVTSRTRCSTTGNAGNYCFIMWVNKQTEHLRRQLKSATASSPNTLTASWILRKIKEKHIDKKCTHWFHVVAIHQWVVACARDRMSTVHNSVWFSAGLQGSRYSPHTARLSCLYSCVCSPHALLPLTYPCWSCSYPQTTYANKGWTIPGSREGWPRVDAITVLQSWSRL